MTSIYSTRLDSIRALNSSQSWASVNFSVELLSCSNRNLLKPEQRILWRKKLAHCCSYSHVFILEELVLIGLTDRMISAGSTEKLLKPTFSRCSACRAGDTRLRADFLTFFRNILSSLPALIKPTFYLFFRSRVLSQDCVLEILLSVTQNPVFLSYR